MGGRAELVFIPCPAIGHLVSMVELAKLLVDREEGLSVAVLVMKLSDNSSLKAMVDSVSASSSSTLIRFVELPQPDLENASVPPGFANLCDTIESYKPRVREAVLELCRSNSSRSDLPRLAGFVVDMFCPTMIDVANDFEVPTYLFYTSSASFLGIMSHLQALKCVHQQDIGKIIESEGTLDYRGFAKPFPAKFLPSEMTNKDLSSLFLGLVKRFQETKGIMVNTFEDVDSRAIECVFDGKLPPLYTVGPLLNLKSDVNNAGSDDILKWLDDQPPASVVFLCFGSMGSFGEDQVREIAHALDKSGHRFLWSLRRPPPMGRFVFPSSNYEDPAEVLPEGFLDRTAEKGKVIGWAPQARVLAHPSVGGFVSHCGWNSILESIWFGVPMAAWPMHAEQHVNAFALVEELGMAVEIRMDYRRDYEAIVPAEDIEKGIRRLMETEREEKKEKMKEMSERSRKAVMEGGSSHFNLGRFIKDVYFQLRV